MVTVVIVNWRSAALTVACLRSLATEAVGFPGLRAVVVDNASGDGEALRQAIRDSGWEGWVSLRIAERNGGFAYGNNLGIEAALRTPSPPDYFLLLNPDTEVRPGAVHALVAFLDRHPDAGIAGGSFENHDGSDWPIAFRFPTVLAQFEQAARIGPVSRLLRRYRVARVMGLAPERVDWVSGASMMVRRTVLEELGGLDEGYFLYFEETDLCLRAARAGWSCWYVPASRVMHLGGGSTGQPGEGRSVPRAPGWWFASRSRYFLKNHGVGYARFADLAFGLGLSLAAVRRIVTRRPDGHPPRLLSDFLRASLLGKRTPRGESPAQRS